MDKEPMTQHGYEKLYNELKHLKEVERPNIVEEIDVARSHGDLKENAEYHAAKEKQVFIESRIGELSDLIQKAQIIDPSNLEHKRVSFGSTVKVMDLDSEDEFEYTLVGRVESNPDRGLISYNSPLAKQLVGKEPEDEVTVRLPGGEKDLEILAVYYKEIHF